MDRTDKLMTLKEVAAYLGTNRQHAWKFTVPALARGAVLPVIKLGPKSWRVRESDLEAWLEQRQADQEGGRL